FPTIFAFATMSSLLKKRYPLASASFALIRSALDEAALALDSVAHVITISIAWIRGFLIIARSSSVAEHLLDEYYPSDSSFSFHTEHKRVLKRCIPLSSPDVRIYPVP